MNLIDTPGHVDFSYEVSRALASCEGVLLLVDASQGVEAQTLANLYAAMEHNLVIIPVINKIDLPSADIERVKDEIDSDLGLDPDTAILVRPRKASASRISSRPSWNAFRRRWAARKAPSPPSSSMPTTTPSGEPS